MAYEQIGTLPMTLGKRKIKIQNRQPLSMLSRQILNVKTSNNIRFTKGAAAGSPKLRWSFLIFIRFHSQVLYESFESKINHDECGSE